VTFTKTGPFADDIEGTVNARAIDGDPAATGTPDGITVSLAHVTMPDQNMSEVEIKYELPENRLDELGASADGLTVHRFDGSNWQNIDVEVTEEAETDTVLTVELSNPTTTYLALTTPVADAGTTNEEISDQSTDSNRTVDDGSIPGFGIAAALLAIVTIVAVLSRQQ
jgi:PGF-CTERM protein